VQLHFFLYFQILPFSPFSPVSRASLIRIRIHATAHTPGAAGAVGLTVSTRGAIAEEIHGPRDRGILGVRRRGPIVGRLDVAKGMAGGQRRIAVGRIHQTRQFRHRRQPPAFRTSDRHVVDTMNRRCEPGGLGVAAGACSHTSPVLLSSTAPVKAVVKRVADAWLVSHRSV